MDLFYMRYDYWFLSGLHITEVILITLICLSKKDPQKLKKKIPIFALNRFSIPPTRALSVCIGLCAHSCVTGGL